MKKYLRLFITGFAMGVADLIPGVSGGTVAFLSGIYEELLHSIKIVSGKVLRFIVQFKIKEAVTAVPFKFLIPLVLGLFSAVLGFANLLSFLLREYSELVWAFFFGLVLSSTYFVAKTITQWDWKTYLFFVIGTCKKENRKENHSNGNYFFHIPVFRVNTNKYKI